MMSTICSIIVSLLGLFTFFFFALLPFALIWTIGSKDRFTCKHLSSGLLKDSFQSSFHLERGYSLSTNLLSFVVAVIIFMIFWGIPLWLIFDTEALEAFRTAMSFRE
jgi:hypothetical protein